MIKQIGIENYKSVEKLDLGIGRFNVFIGENGCGKTNILEAIAFASSYIDLDEGNLAIKGVRVTEPKFLRSGFNQRNVANNIVISLMDFDNNKLEFYFRNSNQPYKKWEGNVVFNDNPDHIRVKDTLNNVRLDVSREELMMQINTLRELAANKGLIFEFDNANTVFVNNKIPDFIVYAPENFFLRNYNIDTPYSQPLGTKGEGLLKLFKVIKKEKPEEYKEILENLHLIDWFENIEMNEDDISGTEFKISDKYLEEGIGTLDIKNANEGFFLLLFYITLFVSDYTPSFFAIDNIDTALNPKLCTKLIEILAALAKKHNKQVLITTHNPSILDGINLNDDDQRLFAVSRNKMGYTRATRIEKKPPLNGEKSLKLSEQFLRGYIGGIPKNF